MKKLRSMVRTAFVYSVCLFSFVLVVLLGNFAVVHADDILVSGAGSTEVNGCYVDQTDGTWIKDGSGNYEVLTVADSYCIIARVSPYGQFYGKSVGAACTSANAAGDTWDLNDIGTEPVPTVSETTCGSGGPPPGAAVGGATSTTEQIQTNLFYGFVLFFISFFMVVWLLRKH